MNNILCSIIIVTFNNLYYNKLCIESIIKNTDLPFEFIFVDNNSTDGTVDYLKTIDKSTLVLNDKNIGFGAACNQGLQKSRGEYIVFLNNDTVVSYGWLERIIEKFGLYPDAGIAGPMSFNSIKGPQKLKAVNYNEKTLIDFEAFSEKHYLENKSLVEQTNFLSGLCLVIKREVIENIGGFDTNFTTGWFEDDDFCLRAILKGYKLLIVKEVFIHHFGSKTFDLIRIDEDRLFNNNLKIFITKWSLINFNVMNLNPELIQEADKEDFIYFSPGEENVLNKSLITELEKYFQKKISYNKLKKEAEILLILDNDNLKALYVLGILFYLDNDFNRSIKIFHKILKADKLNKDICLLMASALEKTGEKTVREAFLKKAQLLSNYGKFYEVLQKYGIITYK